MDPPAYTAPTPAQKPTRTTLDLRAQILANASLLNPKDNAQRASDDHIEIIVAKAGTVPALPPTSDATRATSEKHAIAQTTADSASQSAVDKHYALLVQRSYDRMDLKILIQGEPEESVEEALDWMLERLEGETHGMVVKHGRKLKVWNAV